MNTKRRPGRKGAALLCVAALLLLLTAVAGCGGEPSVDPGPEPVPAPQTADPVEDTKDTDYSALTGDWFEETGYGMLTVYENGGFCMDTVEGRQEGYLVYTEEDGDMWETGPRYELYLENNQRVPGVFLAFDDNHPGKLAYAVGGGAQLFSRDVPPLWEGLPAVEVSWAEDLMLGSSDHNTFTADTEEPQVQIAFTANGVVRDFKVLSLFLQDVDDNGEPTFLVKDLYSQDLLTPWRPLVVETTFYGDIPNNGISYVDADGVTHYYAVSESGMDGSLLLTEF
ncbi:MAG: hypothetical protein IKD96_04995 [Oscillospiraceae bacterium]|nr:hypothetical protein [Oscillospiraceae bacterium]